jgi:hypothetical protein
MVIPREGDKIRVYIQLSDTDAVDPETNRVDLGRYGPERLLEVAKKSVRPYTIDAAADKIEWWTIYQSTLQLQFRRSKIRRDPLNISLADQSGNGLPRGLLHTSGFSSLAMLATLIHRRRVRV